MKRATKATAKPKLKKAQTGGYNDTSGKKKIGPALGIGIPVTGMVAAGANMIKNAVKRRKEGKAAEEETRRALENAKANRTKKSETPAPFNKRKAEKARRIVAKTGGVKKYQTGGANDPAYQAWLAQQAAAAEKKKMTEFTPGQKGTFGTGMMKMPYDLWQMTAKSPANQHSQKYPGTSNKFYSKTDDGFYRPNSDPNENFGYPTSDDNADWQDAYRAQENFHNTLPAAVRSAMAYKKGGSTKTKLAKARYKTGGMVNPNAKVSALKKAGSKGVKPHVNPKATAAKKATGRVGGTSKAPRTAKPKSK